MAQITRASHKDRFQTGDIPTQAHFLDLIDSSNKNWSLPVIVDPLCVLGDVLKYLIIDSHSSLSRALS